MQSYEIKFYIIPIKYLIFNKLSSKPLIFSELQRNLATYFSKKGLKPQKNSISIAYGVQHLEKKNEESTNLLERMETQKGDVSTR